MLLAQVQHTPAGSDGDAAFAPGRGLVELCDVLLAATVVSALLNLLPDARQREEIRLKDPTTM